jgi:hypothetical protein
MKTKITSTVALLALLATITPSYAQYYGQVSVMPPDQSNQIVNNFNKRFEEIRSQIRDASARGQLSQADSANLMNALNQQVSQMQANYASDGGFTNEESTSMVANLTNFANQATNTINASSAGSYSGRLGLTANNGYGNGYHNGRYRHGGRYGGQSNPAVTAAINSRISTLQTQISSLSQTRQLRRRQVSELTASLNHAISMRDDSMRNGINDSEAAQINASLDNVATQIQVATNSTASSRNSWDQRNWDDQRSQLRQNWKDRHVSAVQQQQLDAQMKAQWLQYHHNSWNGQTSWDQYSDPQFLDYLHTKNPSLLTTIRNSLGLN